MTWHLIADVPPPRDRYVLLFDPDEPRTCGNMEIGRWYGDDEPHAGFWSAGGPNGGLELGASWTHWAELPQEPWERSADAP